MATSYERVAATAGLEAKTGYMTEITKAQGIRNKYDEETLELKIEQANQQYAEIIANAPGRKVLWDLKVDNAQQMLDFRTKYPSYFEGAMLRAQTMEELKLQDAEINRMGLDGYNNLSGIARFFDDDPNTPLQYGETDPNTGIRNIIGGDEGQITPQKLELAGQLWSEWFQNFKNTYGEQDKETGQMEFRMPNNPDGSPGAPITFPGMPDVGEPFTAKHIPGLRWATSRFQGWSQFGQRMAEKELAGRSAQTVAQTQADMYKDILNLEKLGQGLEIGEENLTQEEFNTRNAQRLAGMDILQGVFPGMNFDSNGILVPGDYAPGTEHRVPQHSALGSVLMSVLNKFPTTQPEKMGQYLAENWQQVDKFDLSAGGFRELMPGWNDDVFGILPRDLGQRKKFLDANMKTIKSMVDSGEAGSYQEAMDTIIRTVMSDLRNDMLLAPKKYKIHNANTGKMEAFINPVGK